MQHPGKCDKSRLRIWGLLFFGGGLRSRLKHSDFPDETCVRMSVCSGLRLRTTNNERNGKTHDTGTADSQDQVDGHTGKDYNE